MAKKIIIYHTYYGCDTGCCGHSVEIDDHRVAFDFDHPSAKDDIEEWARKVLVAELGEDHVEDLDWENSVICDYDHCHLS